MKKLAIIFCLISLSMASACSAMDWYEAAATGNIEELQRLIQEEPENINTCDVVDNTPLHAAIFSNSEPTLRLLLKNGALAVLNKPNMNDSTPLILAVQKGKNTAVSTLVQEGALVNKPDNYDTTPLHWAATCSNLAAVRILLKNGALAVINNLDKNGMTPLDRARTWSNENTDLIKILERAQQMATFLLALNERTGEDSQEPLPYLPPEMLLHIYKFVEHPSLPLETKE